jgi:SAM-dependent methyltransferase
MSDKNFSDAAAIWNQRFSDSEFLFGTSPNAYLASHRNLFESGKSALAVADGEGRNSVWLAQQGVVVDAFDISSVGVAKARQLAQRVSANVNFNVADCDAWSWKPAGYDYVVAIFVQFADPEMRRRLFANMITALKPGGYLILQGYTPKQLEFATGGPGILANLYTEDLLRSALAELEIREMTAYEEVLSEGKKHSGRSALIGMVGQQPVGI